MRNLGFFLVPVMLLAGVVFFCGRAGTSLAKPRSRVPPPPPSLPLPVATPETPPMPEPTGERHPRLRVHSPEVPEPFPAAEPSPKPAPLPPPPEKLAPGEPQWQVAYSDTFDNADAVKRYYPLNGQLEFSNKYQAMLLRAGDMGDVSAAVHQSLPGDLRIRFRALRRKTSDEVSIGVFFSCKGQPGTMDGYFAEFAGGTAHIKKQRAFQTQRISAPTPQTNDRWVNCEISRVGATLRMSMEGKPVLTWTDPQPVNDAQHDLVAFYVWADSTLVDNLVIERNANDPLKPRAEDPADKYNLLGVVRPANDQPAAGDF